MDFVQNFKHERKTPEVMRRRRHEVTIFLRKKKREDAVSMCRNNHTVKPSNMDDMEVEDPESSSLTIKELARLAKEATDPDQQLKALQSARKLLSSDSCLPIKDILPVLVKCANLHNQPMIRLEATLAICCLTDGRIDACQKIIANGFLPKLISLLGDTKMEVLESALRAAGNIIITTVGVSEIVFDQAFAYFPALLSHPEESVRREAIWLLTNAVTSNKMVAVLQAGLLPRIIENYYSN